MKVLIVSPSSEYINMFRRYGWEITSNIKEADLVQFTGGSDVTPAFYGQGKHPRTYSYESRDKLEEKIFNACIRMDKPMSGICRGGQFLNVMSGGEMFQDVDGHTRTHEANDLETGITTVVTSTHHQMFKPSNKATILLVAQEATFKEYCNEEGGVVREGIQKFWDDVEACYYPHTKSLCFQPHPEFASQACQDLYFGYIKKHLGLSA